MGPSAIDKVFFGSVIRTTAIEQTKLIELEWFKVGLEVDANSHSGNPLMRRKLVVFDFQVYPMRLEVTLLGDMRERLAEEPKVWSNLLEHCHTYPETWSSVDIYGIFPQAGVDPCQSRVFVSSTLDN